MRRFAVVPVFVVPVLLSVSSLLVVYEPAHAATISMEECHSRIADINANLPMALDNITTWLSTTCVDTGSNTIQLIYANEVTDGNAIAQENLDTVWESLVMSWCFGPDLIPLLNVVDTVKYEYHFQNGSKIGELNFSEQDCDMGAAAR